MTPPPTIADVDRVDQPWSDLVRAATALAGFAWSALLLPGSGTLVLRCVARTVGSEAVPPDRFTDAVSDPDKSIGALVRAGAALRQRAVAAGHQVVVVPASLFGFGSLAPSDGSDAGEVVGVLCRPQSLGTGILLGGIHAGEGDVTGRLGRWVSCAELLAAGIAAPSAWVVDRRTRQDLVSENRQLAAEVGIRRQLALTLGTGDLQAMVDAVAELVGSPSAFADPRGRVVACSPQRETAECLTSLRGGAAYDLGACRRVPDRVVLPAWRPGDPSPASLAVPVLARQDHVGWLLVPSRGGEPPRALVALATLAAARVGRAFEVEARVAGAVWDPRHEIARQLVRGGQDGERLRRAGCFFGIDPSAFRTLAYVLPPSGCRPSAADSAFLAENVEGLLDTEVLAVRGAEAVLLLVVAPDDDHCAFEERLDEALVHVVGRRWRGTGAVVGISPVHGATTLRRAYHDALGAARCAVNIAASGRDVVVRSSDLGPAHVFLANADGPAALRYVTDVLGPILDGQDGNEDLLRTLQAYIANGCSVRACAAGLGLHENTVRLRLERVHDATGVDVVRDPGQRLVVETAFLVLRLRNHPALAPERRNDPEATRMVGA